jgi:hypothetical protein
VHLLHDTCWGGGSGSEQIQKNSPLPISGASGHSCGLGMSSKEESRQQGLWARGTQDNRVPWTTVDTVGRAPGFQFWSCSSGWETVSSRGFILVLPWAFGAVWFRWRSCD